MNIEQITALKGELIPAEILSVMSHEAFKSGIMTQDAITAEQGEELIILH